MTQDEKRRVTRALINLAPEDVLSYIYAILIRIVKPVTVTQAFAEVFDPDQKGDRS